MISQQTTSKILKSALRNHTKANKNYMCEKKSVADEPFQH